MCDTLVAVGASGSERCETIFGKNSDRPCDEVQLVAFLPSRTHPTPSKVRCTYISIPQVAETAAVLLSQPYWMWGGEMGANEHGVVIGNEAVWTNEPILTSGGLLGMDLLRLGLERGKNAANAMKVIISLLERYGQGGACTLDGGMYYHNSFIIADAREAWVLETAGKWWAAERVTHGVRNISNGLSITTPGDIHSEGLIEYAIERGLCRDDDDLNFAEMFSSGGWNPHISPHSREGRAKMLLHEKKGEITPRTMADILRDHEVGICMHGGFLSTGAQISVLRPGNQQHWFTGTGPTCESVFHPFEFDDSCAGLTATGPHENINENWTWMKHRRIFQEELAYDSEKRRGIVAELRSMEKDNFKKIAGFRDDDKARLNIQRESWEDFSRILSMVRTSTKGRCSQLDDVRKIAARRE